MCHDRGLALQHFRGYQFQTDFAYQIPSRSWESREYGTRRSWDLEILKTLVVWSIYPLRSPSNA